jgi:Esterase-like activity of phytase
MPPVMKTALVLITCCLGLGLAAGPAMADGRKPDTPQASFLRAKVPVGTDSTGRSWFLGGFSALASIGDSEYLTVTDRGPNDDADRELDDDSGVYCADKPSGKVIFLPGFNPQIVRLEVRDGVVSVRQRIRLHDGRHPASGVPNLTFDENTYTQTDAASKTCAKIPNTGGVIDPFGVDTEGIAMDPRDGSYWLADEYRPSVIHVGRDGQILARIVPGDLPGLSTASDYATAVAAAGGSFAVQPVLPGVVNAFRKNRGFEGLAVSPDGRTLYAVLQSPMDYQALGATNANRNLARNSPYIRVFRLDISKPKAPKLTAEWIYLLSRGFSSDVPDKISDVQWLGKDVLLIQERDDARPTAITNHYRADFTGATNLLAPGPAADLASKTTAPTLEMTNPVPSFITPGSRTLAVDLDQLLADAGFVNSKIEGTATIRRGWWKPPLFAAINDNDFDLDHTVLPDLFPESNPEQVDEFPLGP